MALLTDMHTIGGPVTLDDVARAHAPAPRTPKRRPRCTARRTASSPARSTRPPRAADAAAPATGPVRQA